MEVNVSKLEKKIGISFHKQTLLRQAFTHSSYVNEHRKENSSDNERLEFLGDAVLELAVSQYLYRKMEYMPEGEMTKLRATIVCEASLEKFARKLEFGQYLLLGKGEELTGGRERPAILADVFEAFLGALYLDQGFSVVLTFLEKYIFPEISTGAFSHVMDYKSQLQELVQRHQNQMVQYRILEESGPSHDKQFISVALLNGVIHGKGSGRTKKEAEQLAAREAIASFYQK